MRLRRPSARTATLVFALVVASGCSSAPPAPPTAATNAPAPATTSSAAAAPNGPVDMVTPSTLLPDVVPARGLVAREGTTRRVLIDRMRIVVHDEGAVERAIELLPSGVVRSVLLPSRFGGGYLFFSSTSGSTNLWRARSWLAQLEPIAQLPYVAESIDPGLDRFYVRLGTGQLRAIDATTGEPASIAPLPLASAYGGIVAADGWRAVVDTDVRGLLATFDAGATWRPLAISERPTMSLVNDTIALTVQSGVYLLDPRGGLTFRPNEQREAAAHEADATPKPPGPLGKKPLRAALEDGFADSATTALVARDGALGRVSLKDGALLGLAEDAFPDKRASCHASRVGKGWGFLCGERDGATSVYTFEPPLGMRQVLRFAKPRFVASSGNGALVVRGNCGDEIVDTGDGARPYCIRSVEGEVREVRVRGAESGVERVVALADGRVAIIVPPRGNTLGQLTLLAGRSATSVPLVLGGPRRAAREVRRGMWLEGFEERDKNVIGGWIEAGGPVVGVQIALDGKVKVGEMREDPGGVVVGGRFGFSVGDAGRAAETTDGGLTWQDVDLPEREEASVLASTTRAVGPAGAALGGWMRVGWGKSAVKDDLAVAATPKQVKTASRPVVSLPFYCEGETSVTPPLPPPGIVAAPAPPQVHMIRHHRHGMGVQQLSLTSWRPFRNVLPPKLQPDETGVDNGSTGYELVQLHAYAWGRKGADWARTGAWLMRFDDRFDPGGGLRQSAPTTSPWADEATAAEAIGMGNYGSTQWSAIVEPSGKSALATACHGGGCSVYAVTDGQPVVELRDTNGGTGLPRPMSAVRVGDTWFVLSYGSSVEQLALYRIDVGVARLLATFPRPSQARNMTALLVRRALGTGLGLALTSSPAPRERYASWLVVPIDVDTGALGEATIVASKDFGGKGLERCSPTQDGWLLETTTDISTPVEFATGTAALPFLEMRLRLDPGSACLEGLATRLESPFTKVKPGQPARPQPANAPPKKVDPRTAVDLAATERQTGRRWVFRCSAQPHKK